MKRLLTSDQMKRCDLYTIEVEGIPSRTLMERAARASFDAVMAGGYDLASVCCVCGSGNNGGDGLALAAMLHDAGVRVSFAFVGDEGRATEECRYRLRAVRERGIEEVGSEALGTATLIIDAVLGIGLSGDVRGDAAAVIDAVNSSGVPVVSLDIPSGICADTGRVMGRAVRADRTVAFARMKPGQLLYPGREYCGAVSVADIGIDEAAVSGEAPVIRLTDRSDISEMIPQRPRDSHKGTYGRIFSLSGSVGMSGAAYLSALGAYRSGAGIVEVYTPQANVPVIQTLLPEAIVTAATSPAHLRERLRMATACVLGPGLGTSSDAARLAEEVLSRNIPVVVDADGLNLVSLSETLRDELRARTAPTVITPHPGEASRLLGGSVTEVTRDPVATAIKLSGMFGAVCVMKGSAAVTAWDKVAYINPTGSSALSKGGSGDVLAGMIGAFLGAGGAPLDSAVAAVYLHGLAGEIAADGLSDYSVLASDTARCVGKAILKCLGKIDD